MASIVSSNRPMDMPEEDFRPLPSPTRPVKPKADEGFQPIPNRPGWSKDAKGHLKYDPFQDPKVKRTL